MDKKFRVPRVWSNIELKKFAYLFKGKGVNVSGWTDIDKEGGRYRDYFSNISEYWITNYKSEARGFQGNLENEIFLDLEKDMDVEMFEKFNLVFNHTVLEHVFEVNKAFSNLCKLTNDIVIIIVPFLQEQHADYGDYWRFTPLTLDKLFKKNGMEMVYVNYNDARDDSIYIFAIGTKNINEWNLIRNHKDNKLSIIHSSMIGTKIIRNRSFKAFFDKFKRFFFINHD